MVSLKWKRNILDEEVTTTLLILLLNYMYHYTSIVGKKSLSLQAKGFGINDNANNYIVIAT